jgi:hypothetical protein
MDYDSDVDLIDHKSFAACMSGPGGGVADCCELALRAEQ